jgi:cysteine-rich repeat protein
LISATTASTPFEGDTTVRRSLYLPVTAALLILTAAAPARATELSLRDVYRDGVAGVDALDGPQGLAISPDGAYVYVAGSSESAIAIFQRDAVAGTLTWVGEERNGVDGVTGLGLAQSIAISPDGTSLYVASGDDKAVAVFARNLLTGLLTFVEAKKNGDDGGVVTGLSGAESVAVSPDGKNVYVAADESNAVAVFSRNAASGALTFVEAKRDNTDGVDGLQKARSVAVSADGKNVYVAGSLDNAVAAFGRDATTGALTFLQVMKDGEGGVEGLERARALAVSHDGLDVYVAGGTDDAIAIFERNPATGLLAFHGFLSRATGTRGLDGPQSIFVSDDATRVVVASSIDQSVAIFARDLATGDLTFLDLRRDSESGVDGLGDASAAIVSPDGLHVYAVGFSDDAVAAFLTRCGNGTIDADEQCDDSNTANGDCCSSSCRLDPVGTACEGDRNTCTDDVCSGSGVCEHLNNTLPCEDGKFCTAGDTCGDGLCIPGGPRDCSGAADQCNFGQCDEANDRCTTPRMDGIACDDADACTQADSCLAGVCTGSDPIVCGASDDCHLGVCAPATGLCSQVAKSDGASCNDGDLCTGADTCQLGVCTAGTAVTCAAPSQCQLPGTCVPATGECSYPAKVDGLACDDGESCTAGDACVSGVCQGVAADDRDGDNICDARDVCPDIPDPRQADENGNGVGDACECTAPAPGRCITGGGSKKADCLLEFNPTPAGAPNKKRTTVLGTLRCTDGQASCDMDGAKNGVCTFGVAVCLGNADPRLTKCQPSHMVGLEVLSPNAASKAEVDKQNALALEHSFASMGVEIRRQGQVVTQAASVAPAASCSPLTELVVPAPKGGKPTRRKFKLRGDAEDGRRDLDTLILECR